MNIGGLPFLPNATTLVERFVERLIDKSPEEIQREGILPRGAMEEWESSLDDKVLVGLVSSQDNYVSFIQEGYYQIPVDILKKGWQEAGYVALYVKSGVAEDNGVLEYGGIREVRPVKINGIDFMRFQVDGWRKTPNVIKPVHYGIANYMITTLNTLKEATELPELYMRSQEETTIWRMLRRVSDRIKLELDDAKLDEASYVKEYKIKDITIQFNKAERQILFVKRRETNVFSIDDLEKNPAGVFRVLMEMV